MGYFKNLLWNNYASMLSTVYDSGILTVYESDNELLEIAKDALAKMDIVIRPWWESWIEHYNGIARKIMYLLGYRYVTLIDIVHIGGSDHYQYNDDVGCPLILNKLADRIGEFRFKQVTALENSFVNCRNPDVTGRLQEIRVRASDLEDIYEALPAVLNDIQLLGYTDYEKIVAEYALALLLTPAGSNVSSRWFPFGKMDNPIYRRTMATVAAMQEQSAKENED